MCVYVTMDISINISLQLDHKNNLLQVYHHSKIGKTTSDNLPKTHQKGLTIWKNLKY